MKKIIFTLVILSATMFSCGNAETSTETTDSADSVDSVEVVDSVAVDTIAIDTIA